MSDSQVALKAPNMPQAISASPIAVLYSGGLDSAILLTHLADQGHLVQPLYIESRLYWQPAELKAARKFCRAAAQSNLRPLVTLELRFDDLYGDHWSVTGREAPDASTLDEAVYLLGRNPLLLIKARLWCQLHGVPSLAIGCLGGNPFADATADFFEQFGAALDRATETTVKLVRPFAGFTKREVMLLGAREPLEHTFSCIAPSGELHCGRCNKCAERQRAFAVAGVQDRTVYDGSPTVGKRPRLAKL
jgi:7-cyano-7-deazaguanine synthase